MNLFVEYFKNTNDERQREIENSLATNLSFDFIKDVYIFTSREDASHLNEFLRKFFTATTVHVIEKDIRTTYQDVFNYANEVNQIRERINILLNNDISLTNTFRNLKPLSGDFIALTRWDKFDVKSHAKLLQGTGLDSQDTWAWYGISKIKEADFYMGIPGCDNKITYIANQCGYKLKNPSIDVVTIHNHASDHRTYTLKQRLDRPYLLIRPHKLNENDKENDNEYIHILHS